MQRCRTGSVRTDEASLITDFIDKNLESCPAGSEPTPRPNVEDALVKFAADQGVRTTRAKLVTALKTRMEFHDVSVFLPKQRTFRPYSYQIKEAKTLRMARLL